MVLQMQDVCLQNKFSNLVPYSVFALQYFCFQSSLWLDLWLNWIFVKPGDKEIVQSCVCLFFKEIYLLP